MKKIANSLVVAGILLTVSCSSVKQTGSSSQDDVYYSSKDSKQSQTNQQQFPQQSTTSNSENSVNNQEVSSNNYQQDNPNEYSSTKSNPEYSNSAEIHDASGNTYITNNYYTDDYYDYAYSAKLKRFYSPAYGYGYYDPYYTNLYWYDYNPFSWGVSIYLGYHWWAPSYFYNDPFCYGGCYYPFYSPYYNGYSMGYYNGYNQGYWDGYYHGSYGYNNPYYYNSYDPTSHYYGPRGSISSNGRSTSIASGTGGRVQGTLAEKYERAIADGRVVRTNPKVTEAAVKNIVNSRLPDSKNNTTGPAENIRVDKTDSRNQSDSKQIKTPSSVKNDGKPDVNVPVKGIITNKNETGKPANASKENAVPVNSNPIKYSDRKPAEDRSLVNPKNNPINQDHNNYVRPGNSRNELPVQHNNQEPPRTINGNGAPDNHPVLPKKDNQKSLEETPRNNSNNYNNRQPVPENKPVEAPRNNERPHYQNQQSPRQNSEPGRPHQMSSESSPQIKWREMNHSFGSNPSSAFNGSSSSGGERSSGGSNTGGNGGRGRK
jgi:hypothetical protein